MKNHCDHSHFTAEEVRLLPTGGGGNMILCRRHYLKEIKFRGERNQTLHPADKWKLPKWDDLKVYDGR